MLVKISLRDLSKQETLSKIRELNSEYRKLMAELFSELQSGLIYKELPKGFFAGLPAPIRNKYEDTMSSNRKQIAELYRAFPTFWSEYQTKNKPYFRKEKTEKEKTVDQRSPEWNLEGLKRKELEALPL